MDEDAFHLARAGYERWVLCFDCSTEHVEALWDARDELDRMLHQHWAAIELDTTPKIVQVKQEKAATREQLSDRLDDALGCGVFILYSAARVIMLLNHSVVSGHLGCRLTSWVSTQEWADHIGMPAPSLFTELAAAAIGSWRIWRVPIIRNFWYGEVQKPLAKPSNAGALLRSAQTTQFACHFTVPEGTHPQAVMHEVLTRVTAGWRVTGQPASWTVCSAAPFKEIRGVANNVGVMSYPFAVEPPESSRQLRAELSAAKWQVVLSAAANRTFAGCSEAGLLGAVMSRVVPDMSVGRGLLDAVFSFMVMNLAKTEAVHLYSTDSAFTSSRQKAFIAAAYDKLTRRVHVTLSINPHADELPDCAALRTAGLEPFERFGPFDAARLEARARAD